MAAFDTTRTDLGVAGIAGRIAAVYTALVGGFADWNDTRKTRKALGQLTDRELDDIGLCRGDIDGIAGR